MSKVNEGATRRVGPILLEYTGHSGKVGLKFVICFQKICVSSPSPTPPPSFPSPPVTRKGVVYHLLCPWDSVIESVVLFCQFNTGSEIPVKIFLVAGEHIFLHLFLFRVDILICYVDTYYACVLEILPFRLLSQFINSTLSRENQSKPDTYFNICLC